jgi:hypothetical protein
MYAGPSVSLLRVVAVSATAKRLCSGVEVVNKVKEMNESLLRLNHSGMEEKDQPKYIYR